MEEWITPKEAAQLTGYNEEHIRRLARGGKITAKKWGRDWMIDRISLLDYLQNEGRGPRENEST